MTSVAHALSVVCAVGGAELVKLNFNWSGHGKGVGLDDSIMAGRSFARVNYNIARGE